MKKVIFLCIVSLAVCFVAGNSVPESPPTSSLSPPTTTDPKTVKTTVPVTHDEIKTSSSSSVTLKPVHEATESTTTPKAKTDVQTTTKTPAITTKNATTEALPTSTVTPIPASGNKTDNVKTTTPKAEMSTKAAEPEPKLARGFDGPSFIGGIILTLGLLAIGFMGFKYYKNQTERNYHTL